MEELTSEQIHLQYEYLRLMYRVCTILGIIGIVLGITFNGNLLIFTLMGWPFAMFLWIQSEESLSTLRKRRWERYK